jgi:hypothetical protein
VRARARAHARTHFTHTSHFSMFVPSSGAPREADQVWGRAQSETNIAIRHDVIHSLQNSPTTDGQGFYTGVGPHLGRICRSDRFVN